MAGRRSFAIFAAAALAIFAAASPIHAQATSRASERQLRVMSFNVRYGTARDGENAWPARRELVFETIRAFGPTVLGVQEALDFQVDELAAALPGLEVVGVGRDDGERAGEFAALFVDAARLEILEAGTFWFSDTPAVPGSASWGNRIPRISTWARLRHRATAESFYVYNLHWDHESQASRERSAELLLERMRTRSHPEDPVVVMGDFNAGESNPAFGALLRAPDPGGRADSPLGPRLRDTFRAVHPDAMTVGTFNGFEGRANGEKIDAILASDGWCARAADIVRTARDGRYPSDHFPVTAVLEAAASAGCP